MSDKADKRKPLTERIARMDGSTSYREPMGGFTPGFGRESLTDPDVMAALGMSRARLPDGRPVPDDIGPELLETYYGGSARHRRLIVRSYMRETARADETRGDIVVRRLATTLAVQLLGGGMLTRQDWDEYAWLVCSRRQTLEDCAHESMTWLYDRMARAERLFRAALDGIRESARSDAAIRWEMMRLEPDREARIAAKARGIR